MKRSDLKNGERRLWDAVDRKIRERFLERYMSGMVEEYMSGANPGGRYRFDFVDECLWNSLTPDEIDEIIIKNRSEIKCGMRNALKLWLVKNRCPVFENGREDRLIDAWAREKAVREPLLDSYMDIADDLTVALELGVVRYPKRINGEFVHDGDDGSVIPVDVARNIFALCEKRANEGERGLELTNEITRLERKAVETLLRKGDFNGGTDGRTDAGHNQAGRR